MQLKIIKVETKIYQLKIQNISIQNTFYVNVFLAETNREIGFLTGSE